MLQNMLWFNKSAGHGQDGDYPFSWHLRGRKRNWELRRRPQSNCSTGWPQGALKRSSSWNGYIMLHHATSTESDIPTVESFNFHILGFLILWPSCGSEDAAPVQGASQGAVHPASLFWSGVMSKIQTHLQNTKENWQEYVRSRNTKK